MTTKLNYELTLLIHPDVPFKDARKCIEEHLDKYTKDHEYIQGKENYRLAYPIMGNEYSQYVQHDFRIADADKIRKLTRELENDSRIMRYLCVLSAPKGVK